MTPPGAQLRVAVAVALPFVILQVAGDLVNALALDGRFDALNASAEWSLGAWVSAGAIAAGAVFAGVVACASDERRVVHAAMALGFGFLALDDVLGLHERNVATLERAVAMPRAVDDWPMPILYAPLLLFLAIAVWRETARSAASTVARAGIVVLALALAVRPVGAVLVLGAGYDPGQAARAVAAAAQQGLELGGFVLLAFALAARMRTGRVSAG